MSRFLFILILLFAIPSTAEVTDRHREAVVELLTLMDVERSMTGGAAAMTDVMLQQNPTLRPFRDVLMDWAARTLTWEKLEGRVVAMYVEAFTEAEIRELIAFYKTPTGQKMVKTGPELMTKGAMLGAEVAKENEAELRTMIEKRAAELEKAADPGGQ